MLGLCKAQNGQVLDHQYTSKGWPACCAASNKAPSSSRMGGTTSTLPSAGSAGALASSAAAEAGCAQAKGQGLPNAKAAAPERASHWRRSLHWLAAGRDSPGCSVVFKSNSSVSVRTGQHFVSTTVDRSTTQPALGPSFDRLCKLWACAMRHNPGNSTICTTPARVFWADSNFPCKTVPY